MWNSEIWCIISNAMCKSWQHFEINSSAYIIYSANRLKVDVTMLEIEYVTKTLVSVKRDIL